MQVVINLHQFALTYDFGLGLFTPSICIYLVAEMYTSKVRQECRPTSSFSYTFTDDKTCVFGMETDDGDLMQGHEVQARDA